MKKTVHIIPVGHTRVTLVEGMRQFPFHKIILVLGKEMVSGEKKAEGVARDIEEEFSKIAEVEVLRISIDDVYRGAIDIAGKIKSEQESGNEVLVNASGSLRTVGISCFLACTVTGAVLYVALPSYKGDAISGVRRVLEIPTYPLKRIGEQELGILNFLITKNSVNSVDELIEGLGFKKASSKNFLKERSRISYHIKKLREEGFIKTEKIGKNLRISLTSLGELYFKGRV